MNTKKWGLIYHIKPSAKTEEMMDYFTLDEFEQNQDYLEKHQHLISFIDDEEEIQIPVIYFVDLGYQRKRMTKDFIDVFENDKLYFDLETVKKQKDL